MRATPKLNLLAAVAVLLSANPPAAAEKYSYVDIQKKLEGKYPLTVINAEGGVVSQGITLQLKKSGLVAGSSTSCINEYKDGKIGLGGNLLQKAACARLAGESAGGATRGFVTGEKLYVTRIEVKDSVAFSLISDPISDVTYKAELRLQFPKGTSPDVAQADQLISEVFSIAAPEASAPAAAAAPAPQQAPVPPPQDPAFAPIAPPAPPPDAPATPPPTVGLGMTIDQVVAILGQPERVANVGTKQIYSYNNLKVTFVSGKVTDIQ